MNLKKDSPLDKRRINIAIIEPSEIIYEGLSNMILKAKRNTYIYWLTNLTELDDLFERTNIDIVILNPNVIINREQEFIKYKKRFLKISWIALVYCYCNDQQLNFFNDTIRISESTDTIIKKINNSVVKSDDKVVKEQLSEREIGVLIELVNGLSNKEIADKLCISIHTVISHRKNIVEKTGIKSLPGLTIFAITQKITSVDAISH